ncbi:GT47-family glycosyltransferase [Chara braunii]|uniref:GT47-family glycosyltransferase n=1 Tax=Chara braunii TaxID=69332 RepID=A0A388KHY3_CHABU|nr:GT47-family glycosyltransferase [Chara braunii]|eukprot:GBG69674.1 GT47-family glycosyltransferase [Chara braunii]
MRLHLERFRKPTGHLVSRSGDRSSITSTADYGVRGAKRGKYCPSDDCRAMSILSEYLSRGQNGDTVMGDPDGLNRLTHQLAEALSGHEVQTDTNNKSNDKNKKKNNDDDNDDDDDNKKTNNDNAREMAALQVGRVDPHVGSREDANVDSEGKGGGVGVGVGGGGGGGGGRSWLGNRLVRVYMYDLPRKFTYGVIESYWRSRNLLSSASEEEVGKAVEYPRHQHSAEWWLFLDMMGRKREGGGWKPQSSAVRVFDPDAADVFFVPFFSSLSLLVRSWNGSLRSGGGWKYTVTLQRELLHWLDQQPTWHRHLGRDHVFVAQDPNALDVVRPAIRRSIMMISDFGRMSPDEGNLVKDVVIPYAHRIPTYDEREPEMERTTLLFFSGTRFRKDGGRIRDFLFKVLHNETGVIMAEGLPTNEGTQYARTQMRTSKFCLHPAGDTPSACRLFDAIVNLCVPVVVSDGIELPFENELDYSEFCIFISSEKAVKHGAIVKILRAVKPAQLLKFRKKLWEILLENQSITDQNGTPLVADGMAGSFGQAWIRRGVVRIEDLWSTTLGSWKPLGEVKEILRGLQRVEEHWRQVIEAIPHDWLNLLGPLGVDPTGTWYISDQELEGNVLSPVEGSNSTVRKQSGVFAVFKDRKSISSFGSAACSGNAAGSLLKGSPGLLHCWSKVETPPSPNSCPKNNNVSGNSLIHILLFLNPSGAL